MKTNRFTWMIAVNFAVTCAVSAQRSDGETSACLQAVRTYADNVLRYGRDTYGPEPTPLLVDGVNVDTHEPATWVLPDDCAGAWDMPRRWVMCNPASQQVLYRVFDALTLLTGDPRYHQAAADAMGYAMKHFAYDDGLLFWGGHAMIDLATGTVVGESNKDWSKSPPVPIPANWDTGVFHELKFHYPYYELMWEVDPEATRRFVLAFWASHVQNWQNLDMNRHGVYGRLAGGLSWDHAYEGGAVPFDGRGLSFIHTGSDMIYAAALLSEFTGDRQPLIWAGRLASRYDEIRHPRTHLAADVYNYYRNERLLAQFGPEFGERLTETTIASLYGGRYSYPPVCLLKLAERLGDSGRDFRRLAMTDLRAFARHAYDPADNTFQAMLIDGTKLSPEDVKRPGLPPETFRKRKAGSIHFWAYALAGTSSDDPLLWNTARSIAGHLGLGELGDTAADSPPLKVRADLDDPRLIFALLDLYRITGNIAYREAAQRIGDHVLETRFHHGFFVAGKKHLFARFDSLAPLALLYLVAADTDHSPDMPPYYGGTSYFHGDHEGQGRTYDTSVIYARRRRP